MASIGIHTAAKLSRNSSFLPINNKPNQFLSKNPLLPTYKIPQNPLTASSIAPSQRATLSTQNREQLMDDPASDLRDNHLGKVDSWLQDSVSDIVKNLKQAPLLVQIYSEFDGRIKIQTEKAVSEEWSAARDEWRSGEARSPDGLIFVEELERESGENQGVTRAWGIVVQGKGAGCGPACYLLKTDRVCGGLGLGCCTHFCLMKVNNFRDSASEQFKDSWLLQ